MLGGGIVGYNAALIAVGMQADVWILDRSIDRMRELDPMLDGRATDRDVEPRCRSRRRSPRPTSSSARCSCPGARAPKLVTREMLGLMKPGAVLVDVAIDQGGCFETSHPTTHSDPTYVVDGIVHYCVANMPGAVPITSTHGAHERDAARTSRRSRPRASPRPCAVIARWRAASAWSAAR